MTPRPLLNIDLAEFPNEPSQLFAFADIANLACGGHAGDDATVTRAIALCLEHNTRVGAHPSYPDRAGFGRTSLDMQLDALRDAIRSQCAWLAARVANVQFVKPHGALYHDAERDPARAQMLVNVSLDTFGPSVAIIGGPRLCEAARAIGLRALREQFADRGVRADGSLIPRTEPGALITDPLVAAERARTLRRAGTCDTLCLHGDTPGAELIARAVRDALEAQ